MIAGILGVLVLGALVMMKQKMPVVSEEVSEFNQWDYLIKKYATEYGIDWQWMKAIMLNESDLGRAASVKRGLTNPQDIERSKSSDGKSWGLMQLTLPTARQFESTVTQVGLNDPEISVRIAAKYLQWLSKRNYKGYSKEEFMIRAYNGGPGFMTTPAGIRDTPAYYAKFLKNLQRVKAGE